jgi:hypothetical protein
MGEKRERENKSSIFRLQVRRSGRQYSSEPRVENGYTTRCPATARLLLVLPGYMGMASFVLSCLSTVMLWGGHLRGPAHSPKDRRPCCLGIHAFDFSFCIVDRLNISYTNVQLIL